MEPPVIYGGAIDLRCLQGQEMLPGSLWIVAWALLGAVVLSRGARKRLA